MTRRRWGDIREGCHRTIIASKDEAQTLSLAFVDKNYTRQGSYVLSLSGFRTLSLFLACNHVTIMGKEAGAGWEVTSLERQLIL